jgi:hypothetical protein
MMSATGLSEQLVAFVDSLTTDMAESERLQLLAACDKAKEKLEKPIETTARLMFGVGNRLHICSVKHLKLNRDTKVSHFDWRSI